MIFFKAPAIIPYLHMSIFFTALSVSLLGENFSTSAKIILAIRPFLIFNEISIKIIK